MSLRKDARSWPKAGARLVAALLGFLAACSQEPATHETIALSTGDAIEVRKGDSVVNRRRAHSWRFTASRSKIASHSREGIAVYGPSGDRELRDLDISGLRFHLEDELLLGVTSGEGDFDGLAVVDLENWERRTVAFEVATYHRPRAFWLGTQVAYEDPAGSKGEIRIWAPDSGDLRLTRCQGILMGASRGELLLTGSLYRGKPMVTGPLRWCDPWSGRGAEILARSGHGEVVAIAPSGELLALVRSSGVTIMDRSGRPRRVVKREQGLGLLKDEVYAAFVNWSSDSRKVAVGYGEFEADHQLPGPAWSIDVESGAVVPLGEAVGYAAFVQWPRWSRVQRLIFRMRFFGALLLALTGLLAVAVLAARVYLPALQKARLRFNRPICSSCGQRAGSAARFCGLCGAPLDTRPPS